MKFNFSFTSALFVLITSLGPNALIGQTIQPTGKQIAICHVVNLATIANGQQQAAHIVNSEVPGDGGREYPAVMSGNSHNLPTNVLRGAGDSVSASPAPVTSFGAQNFDGSRPPCTNGAASEDYLLSFSKYSLLVQDRTGAILGQVNPYNIWIGAVSFGSIWENRVAYDPSVNRWIMTCFCDEHTDTAGVLVAISQTGNPMGNWNIYKVSADSTGRTDSEVPNLGFNKNWIAVSGKSYVIDSTNTDTSALYVFDKTAMMNGAITGCTVFKMGGTKNTIAQTYDTTISEIYMLAEWNNGNGQLQMFDISNNTGALEVNLLGYVTRNVPYGSEAPNGEDFAPQPGTGIKLQTGDDAPVSLVCTNGHLWCAQSVFLPSNNPTRSSVQWWQIDTFGNALQLGLIDDSVDGIFYAFPSIAVNKYNDALIGYSVFSAQQYAGCGYSYHDHNQAEGVADSSFVFKTGQNMYGDSIGGNDNSLGFWSATVVDPLDNAGFWTIQTYAASTANTWGTWWAQVDNYNNTAVDNIKPAAHALQISPNPNTGAFNLVINGTPGDNARLKIIDMVGKEVFSSAIIVTAGQKVMPVITQGLSKGVYLVELYADNGISTQKLVIQ